MNFSRLLTLFLFLASVFLFNGCTKEGLGGKNTLSVSVKHHEKVIPNAVVYIKFGAREFPGAESKNYDLSSTCDSQGNVKFENLKKGFYYLYSIGYDDGILMDVKGGTPVEIRQKSGEKIIVLPVTEDEH